MTSFVNEAEQVNRVVPHFILNVKRKWFQSAARETVRANVVPAFPADDLPRLSGNTLAKLAGQPVGDLAISCLHFQQIGLEAGAENGFHAGTPKT